MKMFIDGDDVDKTDYNCSQNRFSQIINRIMTTKYIIIIGLVFCNYVLMMIMIIIFSFGIKGLF